MMFTDLYELRVSVQPNGIRALVRKYYVKVTKANYLPERIPDTRENEGYSVALYQRVKLGEVMKLRRSLFGDHVDSVVREIYYLQGQEEEARARVNAELDKTIRSMAEQMDMLHAAWVSETVRPVN
jgi:hypothetical protein